MMKEKQIMILRVPYLSNRRPMQLAATCLGFAALVLSFVASGARHPAQAANDAFDPAQKVQIEAIIKDYLLKNPELLIEVQRVLDQKQQLAQQENMSKAVATNSQSLFKDAAVPSAGATKGDVTVVEFFDYNCVHCRDAVDHMGKLLDADKKVHVVFMDFPIFGKDSEGAARVAMAAAKQGKYLSLIHI